jgi:hypothetical protein
VDSWEIRVLRDQIFDVILLIERNVILSISLDYLEYTNEIFLLYLNDKFIDVQTPMCTIPKEPFRTPVDRDMMFCK